MVKRNYSQVDEQSRLERIFGVIGIKHRICLEFGAGDGFSYSNTRHFIDNMNFKGFLWDINPRGNGVIQEKVTAENINELYEKYELNNGCDLISIDVDGNDYWIWKSLKYSPRIVIIEYNCSIAKNKSVTVEYNPDFAHDMTDYYGASWSALLKLGTEKGYILVDSTPLNMIFVFGTEMVPQLNFGQLNYEVRQSFAGDTLNRKWIEI